MFSSLLITKLFNIIHISNDNYIFFILEDFLLIKGLKVKQRLRFQKQGESQITSKFSIISFSLLSSHNHDFLVINFLISWFICFFWICWLEWLLHSWHSYWLLDIIRHNGRSTFREILLCHNAHHVMLVEPLLDGLYTLENAVPAKSRHRATRIHVEANYLYFVTFLVKNLILYLTHCWEYTIGGWLRLKIKLIRTHYSI